MTGVEVALYEVDATGGNCKFLHDITVPAEDTAVRLDEIREYIEEVKLLDHEFDFWNDFSSKRLVKQVEGAFKLEGPNVLVVAALDDPVPKDPVPKKPRLESENLSCEESSGIVSISSNSNVDQDASTRPDRRDLDPLDEGPSKKDPHSAQTGRVRNPSRTVDHTSYFEEGSLEYFIEKWNREHLSDSDISDREEFLDELRSEHFFDDNCRTEMLHYDERESWIRGQRALERKMRESDRSEHLWWVESWDDGVEPIVRIWCQECKKFQGNGDVRQHSSTFSNFFRRHVPCAMHMKAYNGRMEEEAAAEARRAAEEAQPKIHKRTSFVTTHVPCSSISRRRGNLDVFQRGTLGSLLTHNSCSLLTVRVYGAFVWRSTTIRFGPTITQFMYMFGATPGQGRPNVKE